MLATDAAMVLLRIVHGPGGSLPLAISVLAVAGSVSPPTSPGSSLSGGRSQSLGARLRPKRRCGSWCSNTGSSSPSVSFSLVLLAVVFMSSARYL